MAEVVGGHFAGMVWLPIGDPEQAKDVWFTGIWPYEELADLVEKIAHETIAKWDDVGKHFWPAEDKPKAALRAFSKAKENGQFISGRNS
jgi:hypothetical protein